MSDKSAPLFFEVFNEIGIIAQLSRALLESRLPDGLISPHFAVINHLIRLGDGSTPIEMARAFQVPKTSMTHTLKGLEEGGYVAIKTNPDDGRSKRVWLTEKGRTMRDQAIAAMAPNLARMAAEFDVEKLASIKPVLSELRLYLDQNRPAAKT